MTISAALVMCDPVEQLELAVRVRSCSLFFVYLFGEECVYVRLFVINQLTGLEKKRPD